MKRVLIMAGGTGGHIFPALAVATLLRERGVTVHWLGTPQGMESKLIPTQNIPISYITISGLRGKNKLSLVSAPWRLVRALWQAQKIIRTFKPDVVLGMGGFASGPGGVAAKLLGKRLVIHEQNAVAGFTNRSLARVADVILTAFPNAFPSSYHTICIGNPVRREISTLPLPSVRWRERQGQKINCLILGGSQGASALNQFIPAVLAKLNATQHISIWHQAGNNHVQICQQHYADLGCDAKVDAFISDMAAAYAWADLVICRAGALTVSELMAAGVGSILIPFPHAVDDHQTKNAEFLVKNNAGILIPQRELTIENLMPLLAALFSAPTKLLAMAEAARNLSAAEAAQAVVENLEKCSG